MKEPPPMMIDPEIEGELYTPKYDKRYMLLAGFYFLFTLLLIMGWWLL
jgi:hypothetical protein